MARTAAIELVEHTIRVNIVTPGWIDTPGERKFASDETIRRLGREAAVGTIGHGCGDRPRRRVSLRSGQRLYYGQFADDRRWHHAAVVGQPRLGRARVSETARVACGLFDMLLWIRDGRLSLALFVRPKGADFDPSRRANRYAASAGPNCKCPRCAAWMIWNSPIRRAPITHRAWDNRHRVIFAFLVGAIASLALAAFMAIRMPAKIELPVVSIDANTPILAVYDVYYDLQRGIDIDPRLALSRRAPQASFANCCCGACASHSASAASAPLRQSPSCFPAGRKNGNDARPHSTCLVAIAARDRLFDRWDTHESRLHQRHRSAGA